MNGARGEVRVQLDGEMRVLCLTLGALAEIETVLDLDGLDDLVRRLRSLSARDLIVILAALLRGGGEAACADRLAMANVDAREAADALAQAFRAAAA